jgi:16S rRNA (cytidine1402-2'-O)-methyltransferase
MTNSDLPQSNQDRPLGQSSQTLKPGLYVVATPIGNLRDITLRALDVLEAADTVFAEDTRVAQKLLSAYGIKAKLERCDAHTEEKAAEKVGRLVAERKLVAFVSDAGTPAISDPGALLVAACRAKNIPVFPIPGANAAAAALSASGFTEPRFLFVGFLASKSAARRQELQELRNMAATLVLYEAPQRLEGLLEDILSMCGERKIAVARELTKLHEEFLSDDVSEVLEKIAGREIKGEVVVLVAPDAASVGEWTQEKIDTLLIDLMKKLSVKEAVAQVTAVTGLPRKEIYARALSLGKK